LIDWPARVAQPLTASVASKTARQGLDDSRICRNSLGVSRNADGEPSVTPDLAFTDTRTKPSLASSVPEALAQKVAGSERRGVVGQRCL